MAARLLLIVFCWVLSSQAAVVWGPVVDLGYELHEATVNETGNYYNFSNVRYASAPVGNLRFAAPVSPPKAKKPIINNGQTTFICPQGIPYWSNIAFARLAGRNVSLGNESDYKIADIPPVDPRTNEDCLLLDITVPMSVFDGRRRNISGAPVLLWFHGGGFVLGNKGGWGNGAGLVGRSLENNQSGIIYVAANYRLGLFGWLSGHDSITSNAGLLDQKLAIEWVRKHIHLFGGDPNKISVIGESAGGGSLMTLITTNGGNNGKEALFSRAILQSPWLPPLREESQAIALYNQVLQAADVSSPDQLRDAPSETLQTVNSLLIGRAPFGTYVFGPLIDHKTIPDDPRRLLKNGSFKLTIGLMIGHNSNEGAFFTPPSTTASCSFECFFSRVLPQLSQETLSYISSSLYHFGQSTPTNNITSMREQYELAYGNFSINCNIEYLKSAYQDRLYAYIFSQPPGVHTTDLLFTFSNVADQGDGVMDDAWLAVIMQRYFVNFALSGSPNTPLPVPEFPQFSNNSMVMNFNTVGFGARQDDVDEQKCKGWECLLGY
ncbi:uncharacterized protein K452DRAFT_219186 [Aplosporella prunicola CBS 121167]|uniref:Carboxylic ester hydrolase n=1 Tax=Aplosporella prunicola CBS 121167 TaxID=1176127 RepID=A0A6A6BUN2_9PEZI|nr:uncharacterized protein K452DRAFT_219186 [Aplosporella prunicola CBS 121167]KAF2146985.1 hypothetical protein K452DRAFT_219186 [Aplosporella prunicola CBS 121167]